MAGKMSKEKWIRAGTKLAEPLKEFERAVEQLGLGLVHMTAHGCKGGLRASALFVEDGVWYEVNVVDNTIRLVVDGDQFYTQT